ncbi:uncharacterized protein LOC143296429 [Babylonia areolata]|uniref:uncharacterized protein LOC143296429 n=1 Tax=Babylonia areolata TaxID=304850 RepID=UPI003FD4403F
MENVRLIYSVDKPSNLRSLVKQDLRELGVKVPKLKKSKKLNQSRNSSQSQEGILTPNIFGNFLSLVPSKYVSDCGFVPRFLVEAAELIEKHCGVEGIFRKSGSISRQKELKQQIEEGQAVHSENIHDVTGLVKQFFRELPEPLFTCVFHDTFVRCYHLDPSKQVEAMLLLCLMLPMEHLSTLRFTMKLLSRLAAHCSQNKMDVGNLAVVLAPNIMHVNSRSQKMNATEEKLLQIQTAIVGMLIRKAESIGVVSDGLHQRTVLMTECFGTEDELDASDDNTLEDSKDTREVRKKARKRSNSLQGIVSSIGRGFAKLRRSTDGKNTSATCSSEYQEGEAVQIPQSESLSVTQPPLELSLPPQDQPIVTPVVMRKRRMSGESVPFSATKRKAILEQLPHKSTLGATPFTPASSKKRQPFNMRVEGTPVLSLTDKSQQDPEATPKQDSSNKSIRKKINLFSPASGRKSKRCKTQMVSCGSALRKSGRTKHIFRRLSGGKDREMDEEEEEQASSPSRVPQSQSAMELSGMEKSTLGLNRTVSSPSLHDSYSGSPEDPNSLNQGFIDPDVTACADVTTSQAGPKERGRTLRRADSFKPGQKPVRRSASTDGALRRGQPNKLSNGLMEGKTENVKKLRRSFDKSDISHPIPIVFPSVTNEMYTADTLKEVASVNSAKEMIIDEQEMRSAVVSREQKSKGTNRSVERHGQPGEQSMDMESSLLNVVLPPPSGFNDQSMMEVSSEKEENWDNESEAGFSTISGGTVIHQSPAHLHSLQAGIALPAGSIVHYGSSVSVNTLPVPPTLQSSVSADSLISTESESSEAGLTLGILNRSTSVDSGKGSLLENAETRSSRQSTNPTVVKSRDLETARIQLESRSSSSTENLSLCFSNTHSLKSVSAEDLKATRKVEKPATRCHSMYIGGPSHHSNMIPNLQISAETHRLLTRAGFLETSLPPHVKDTIVPIRSPQTKDSARQSFRRDQYHTCSFRLEKSGTFRKDRSSILFAEHPTPVEKETIMEQGEMEECSQCSSRDHQYKPVEDMRVASVSRACEHGSDKQEVWVKMDQGVTEPASAQRETRADHVPSFSVNLKRAELRMQKHESVLNIKESNAGRVAHSVRQINSSLDNSVDQASTSLHFQQCTTRKRGVSPIRIPTIFAKNKADTSSAHYKELAQKYQRRAEQSDVKAKFVDKQNTEQTTEEPRPTHHQDNDQRKERCVVENGSNSPKKRKSGTDLSTSLLETIKEVVTPHRQKCADAAQLTDASRSPLREFTNTKSGPSEDSVQLRTSKGLTPHQVLKYGTKGSISNRSPCKPVKRLNSPRSPHGSHSPQKSRERDQPFESHHFHENY